MNNSNINLVKVAAAVPSLIVADPQNNSKEIIELIKDANSKEAGVIVFPELCLTSSSCGDLFFQSQLYKKQLVALEKIINKTKDLNIISILGIYINKGNQLYNCAIIIQSGNIMGIVPKESFPTGKNSSWFSPITLSKKESHFIQLLNKDIPFGNIIFKDKNSGFSFSVEIGTDLNLPISPSTKAAMFGAQGIFNCASQTSSINKSKETKEALSVHSKKNLCAYIYASAGPCESTGESVFSGQSIIAEAGTILSEDTSLSFDSKVLYNDLDLDRITFKKLNNNRNDSWNNFIDEFSYETIYTKSITLLNEKSELSRVYIQEPFMTTSKTNNLERVETIFNIQTMSLGKRLLHTNSKTSVIGISGGLDSTLALLATVSAYKKIRKKTSDIIAITMPGFGTTDRTYNNAIEMMKLLGVTIREIPIRESVLQHFKDINHDENIKDITYENAQARERTQILMDVANDNQGLVVGTGDLSEMALGWCTYNGDHMSMYGINGGIPKTVIRHVVAWIAESLSEDSFQEDFSASSQQLSKVLREILETPISPELLPPEKNGQISQATEDSVGPYLLHDFFIYHTMSSGASPAKLLFLANKSFHGVYDDPFIRKWLKVFYKRFFSQQFKRNCVPDGPKVGTINFSPRGQWSMPSDAVSSAWLEDM